MSCVAADALFEELRQRAPYASDLFDIALNAICALQTCEGELSRVVSRAEGAERDAAFLRDLIAQNGQEWAALVRSGVAADAQTVAQIGMQARHETKGQE